MPTHSGHEGLVTVAANTIAELIGWSYDESAEVIEDTELSDTAKTFIAGQTSWTASCECHLDETDTNGQVALSIGASVTLFFYHEGNTSGDEYKTGTGIITGRSVSGGGGDTAKISFSVQGTGALADGTVV